MTFNRSKINNKTNTISTVKSTTANYNKNTNGAHVDDSMKILAESREKSVKLILI